MTNSKEMPTWFKSITVAAKVEPLDYLALAEDISFSPMTAETVHYIHVLLQHMEDEHSFRRTAFTENEINARIILKGYLRQVEEVHGKTCFMCRGSGNISRVFPERYQVECRACDGKGRIK